MRNISQKQEVTRNPDWSHKPVDIDDIEDNELLQFTIYHNSKNKPHLPVAHMDLDIATLREHLDKSGEEMIKFQEKFSGSNLERKKHHIINYYHTFSWRNHRLSDFDGG